MTLDPQCRALLDGLYRAGMAPMVRASAQETRDAYRSRALSRRTGDYVPEQVASVVDQLVDGSAAKVPVRVYTPAHASKRVVTYMHGGGYVCGDLDTHDPICRRIANGLGATVVAVDYRLAPEHPYPAALEDTMAVVRWTSELFRDHTHIVAGDSAGGTLAAGAAVTARDERGPALAAQLLLYPVTDPSMSSPSVRENGHGYFLTRDDMQWFTDQYFPNGGLTDPVVDLLGSADLIGLPPTVVATAEYDPLRDEGDAFADRLRDADVPVEYVPAAGLIHGYFHFLGAVDAADTSADLVIGTLDQLLTRTS